MNTNFEIQRMNPVVDGFEEVQFIALVEGRCVGRVGVAEADGNAAVRQLWVDQPYTRRGIGGALLGCCECEAAKRESEAVILSAQGPVLRKWYEARGYKVYDRSAVGFHMVKYVKDFPQIQGGPQIPSKDQ